MRWFGLVAVSVSVGACASTAAKEDSASATPEETLCFRAATHLAAIMAGKADAEMDQSEMGDIRKGCRAPEASRPDVQAQFQCMMAATDMNGLEACKVAADANRPVPE